MAITWLFDRNGCTYNRFQKFVELDLRVQALKEEWAILPPRYNVERYRNHYYHQDFDALKKKFVESEEERKKHGKEARKKGRREIRDFIPYKVAVRIRESITFSVKLDGRCPDLKLDSATKSMLARYDKACYGDDYYGINKRQGSKAEGTTIIEAGFDYEAHAALKDHKIKLLKSTLEQAIERKYRISFAKGFQLVYEQLILLICMMSMLLKANIFSIIYLLFVIRYLKTDNKIQILCRLVRIICMSFIAQYILYLINLTA